MLSRATYEEAKRDIQDHADIFTTELRNELAAQTSLFKAIQAANKVAGRYHSAVGQTIYSRLHDTAERAVNYYGGNLEDAAKAEEVSKAMDELMHSKYYGLTLPNRLKQSRLELRKNIQRSSVVGTHLDTKLQNITRVLNDKYPFGAHKHWDIRLFLSEAVRVEHIIARNIGHRRGRKLVKWTLSHTHTQTDVCDHLATAVDPAVRQYLEANHYNISPEGVYFIEYVPSPPHPNCQCVLRYVHKKRRPRTPEPPPLSLIRRILKAIFG